MKRKMLCVEVDTNDGDYEKHLTEITVDNSEEVESFLEVVNRLPKKESYYYGNGGEKISRGNVIFFDHNRVGKFLDYEECALKALVLPFEDFIKDEWTKDEMIAEGYISEEEYTLLCKYLPMYINEGFGFHTIVSITVEEHTDVVILNTIEF